MKVYTIYNTDGYINTYLIGSENGGDAIIIDPGQTDLHLLNIIENNDYYLKSIFVTHAHEKHIKGIRTLLKIYDANIYSKLPLINETETITLKDGDTLNLSGYDISVIDIPGHSDDSIVFKIRNILFTGDVLSAGMIGSTTSSESKKMLQKGIIKKLFSFKEDLIVFPGHGAPSTLDVEKKMNPYLNIS
jgi:hydroxyacylglutathione hydrolase